MEVKKKYTRRFLGQLFPERKDANYEKAHLKAYLNGNDVFHYGYYYENGLRKPAPHQVKQELIQIN